IDHADLRISLREMRPSLRALAENVRSRSAAVSGVQDAGGGAVDFRRGLSSEGQRLVRDRLQAGQSSQYRRGEGGGKRKERCLFRQWRDIERTIVRQGCGKEKAHQRQGQRQRRLNGADPASWLLKCAADRDA